MKKLTILAALGLFVAILAPAPTAQTHGAVDQSSPGFPATFDSAATIFSEPLTQQFTPSVSPLVGVNLRLLALNPASCPGDVTVKIRSGSTVGPVLGQVTLNNLTPPDLPGVGDIQHFDFTPVIAVVPGNVHFIEASALSICVAWMSNSGTRQYQTCGPDTLLASLTCTTAPTPANTPTPTPPATPPPTITPTPITPTIACAPARPHAAGTTFNETIDSGGFTRTYILDVPTSYTGTDAVPLVFNLHGFGGSANFQRFYSELWAKGEEAGFILVSLDGWPTAGTFEPRPHWNITTIEPNAPDDVAFIGDLLDALASQLCIEATRVYSTGFSNGGEMSVRLACNLSERIAAVAPVAGVYFPPRYVNLLTDEPPGCASGRPVPIIAFHGADDPIVPFQGGFSAAINLTLRLGVEGIMAQWGAHHLCNSIPTESQAAPGVRLVRYEGCSENATLELYIVEDADGAGPGTEGGGHAWPGATLDIGQFTAFGQTTHEINATDLMWEFFEMHTLAGVGPISPPATPQVAPPQAGTGISSGGGSTAGWLFVFLAGVTVATLLAGVLLLRART